MNRAALITLWVIPCIVLSFLSLCVTPHVDAQVIQTSSTDRYHPIYESGNAFQINNTIDALLLECLKEHGLKPAAQCSDVVFIRRVYLDVLGVLPEEKQVKAFVNDQSNDKRSKLIDALLEHPYYADYWTMRWCDLLRVKSEYPINLWPNGVQSYAKWIHQSIRQNKRYDQFVQELLTSSGSNFRVPPVNFYRAMQGREPRTIATMVARTWMGVNLESWSEQQQAQFIDFFSRVAYKGTAEWKEEIVYLNPAPVQNKTYIFPDGKNTVLTMDHDPRIAFANWLIHDDNQIFTQCIINRMWAWTMGTGLIDVAEGKEAVQSITHPKLMAYLQKELVDNDYDLKNILRIILNSSTYQQSAIPATNDVNVQKYFACYPIRRMDAEVIIDALNIRLGSSDAYMSMIPEPFTYVPEFQRAVQLYDGSITSSFLETFGRPTRDTGLLAERDKRMTVRQRLHMLNSSHIQKKIEKSPWIKQLIKDHRKHPRQLVHAIYHGLLSRPATEKEMKIALTYLRDTEAMVAEMNAAVKDKEAHKKNERYQRYQAFQKNLNDLVWALINSKEFLYHH